MQNSLHIKILNSISKSHLHSLKGILNEGGVTEVPKLEYIPVLTNMMYCDLPSKYL